MTRLGRGALALLISAGGCATEPPLPAPASTPERPAPEATPSPAEPVEAPRQPVVNAAASVAHLRAQRGLLGAALEDHPLIHFVPIEDPSGRALHDFYASLNALDDRDEATASDALKVRVLVYGSSSVAADRYTAYLRAYLQDRFGDGGVGFVSLVPLWRWHRHDSVSLQASKHWTVLHAQKKLPELDGYFGLNGAATAASHRHARSSVAPRRGTMSNMVELDEVELHFFAQPNGGHFSVAQGRNPPRVISTQASTPGPGYASISGPAGGGVVFPLQIRVRGDGEVRLFGATLERRGRGVVVDELGIGGSRAANLLDWNVTAWTDHVARRDPRLIVLAYGANEAIDDDEPIALYRDNLKTVLEHVRRASPTASCVLVGPQDFPVFDDASETWLTRPRLDEIIKTQREMATLHGCGFFDTREFMGGMGSMVSWASADPPLAKADHLHFTTLGYAHLGRVLADALMWGFDRAST